MSTNVITERSVILRLEFSIADAVRHRGIFAVLGAALRAWWAQRPARYHRVPAHLRQDLGLIDTAGPAHWTGVDLHTYTLHRSDGNSP